MQVETVQEAKSARRRRRRSKEKPATWDAFFRGDDFGRAVFLGMCLLGAAYCAKVVWDTRWASILYNMVLIDLPEAEVRYVLGAPPVVEDGGRLFRYDEGNRTIVTRFSDPGLMTSISCTAEPNFASACEPTLGVGIGTPEDRLLLLLGPPSRISFQGNDKLIYYDGLGLTFRMRKFRVHTLELRQGGNPVGYIGRSLWRLIP